VKLVVPKETRIGERRVAMVPDGVKRLMSSGWEVTIESSAGAAASFPDSAYEAAGATVTEDLDSASSGADLVVKVNALTLDEARVFPSDTAVLSFLQPAASLESLNELVKKRSTVFSFDLLPRISRAQGMDALSSQATVSGYRAALVGAEHLGKFFPMFMTAAGTVPPAKVLVMGVGVAGLQAIATARRLGAVVRAYDVRSAAKEEAESLGATFVDLGVSAEGSGGYARELSEEEQQKQRDALSAEVAVSDVVITTAAVPGRAAPLLVTREMVEGMSQGAIVVDMAADSGGNCEVTEVGKVVEVDGVSVVGMENPPSGMATHASFLYSRNVLNFVGLLVRDGSMNPDFNDEIVLGTCVVRDGQVVHGPTSDLIADSRAEGSS
jgi:NAD(P) transhydrogenase subunit alpha